jgi:hypothetical protein
MTTTGLFTDPAGERLLKSIRCGGAVGTRDALELLRLTRKAGCKALDDELYRARVLVGLVKGGEVGSITELAQKVDEGPSCLCRCKAQK